VLSVIDYVIDRRREILHACAWDNDRIATSVSFLGDPKEFPSVVLPELHVKMLPLDLQFPGLYDVIHFLGKNGGVYDVRTHKGKQIFGPKRAL
jgi:hypothetical protein